MALKTHFLTVSYDYFKFKGKLKLSEKSFEVRHDRFVYNKLHKIIPKEQELIEHIVANLLKEKKWIGEFLEQDAMENAKQYRKRIQSITHTFEEELTTVMNRPDVISLNNLFKITEHKYPILIDVFYEQDISYISLVVLNNFIPFVDKFNKYIGKDDMLWTKPSKFIVKLSPFIKYDSGKMKDVIKKFI